MQYIDYGNTEEIQATGLLEIPPTVAAHKPLAYKIVLHNIMVKDVTDQNVNSPQKMKDHLNFVKMV